MGILIIVIFVLNCNSFSSNRRATKRYTVVGFLKKYHGPVALAVVISNDLKYTDKSIKSEALTVADEIRKFVPNVPICIVAQSDNREKT
ncbi:hypothetical protein LOAG_13867 [Loa loa]|uniref:Uncharacterized protein n=1 Tax=Loa loa TaxID=7209 RepID=A0A1S0TK40_LOALO|nr:hypothetical protein LOAG_13867 [Loa loa]EFO14650.2 hypothetical protein LOAG_13867 [Loa loa]